MDKSSKIKSKLAREWFQFTELLAYAILYTKTPQGITMEADVKYGERPLEVADLIYPSEKGDKKRPVMIYIHGGGWISGRKNMRRSYCYEYAKQGYFVANIDYDYAPVKQFPVSIQQCLNAVDFVYDNAEKYNLDLSRVLLAGESAGAYYVAMLAAIAKDKSVLEKLGGLTLKHTEFDVKVNLFNCGAFDMESLASSKFPLMGIMFESFTDIKGSDVVAGKYLDTIKMMSPVSYLNEKFPPTYMLYASKDALQIDTFAMKKRLDWLGINNEIYKCDGPLFGNHAFALATITDKGRTIFAASQKFVRKYIFDEVEDEK